MTRLFEALPNEALEFFWVRIFSGGFKMRLQRNLVACLFWLTVKTYKAKILQGALLIQYRTWKLYSAWLVNWLSLNFNFSKKSRDYTISLICLLMIFHRFQEKLMKHLNISNRVFIELYQFFINLASEITRLAHPWTNFVWKPKFFIRKR